MARTSKKVIIKKKSIKKPKVRPATKMARVVAYKETPSKSRDGKHFSTRAPEPVGPYPHARRVGEFIYVSGMGPRKRGSKDIPGVYQDALGRVVSYDIEVQTRSTIENIRMILEEMGSSLADVVDVTVFLTHMKADFPAFNRVYGEYFAKVGPTRTTCEVLSLPTSIAVELKVVAWQRV